MTAMPKKLRSQVNDLAPKKLVGIGRVAAELTEFEGSLEHMIWGLAGLEDEVLASCITSHMDLPKKLDALLELAREAHPQSALMKLLIEVDQTLRPAKAWQRNLIGRAIWSLGGALAQAASESKSATQKVIKRSRKKYSSEVNIVSSDGLDDIADRIASATHRLRVVFAVMRQKGQLGKGRFKIKKKPRPKKAKKRIPKKDKKRGKSRR